MAYTVAKRQVTYTYIDARDENRQRVVEISAANVLTDDDAIDMDGVSKSAVVAYMESIKQVDLALPVDTDSEVNDTARLYFRMDDNTKAHFDIVDPKDELFLSTSGAGANIVIAYADLDVLDPPQLSLKQLIDRILSGDIYISDGETPNAYLNGERI